MIVWDSFEEKMTELEEELGLESGQSRRSRLLPMQEKMLPPPWNRVMSWGTGHKLKVDEHRVDDITLFAVMRNTIFCSNH